MAIIWAICRRDLIQHFTTPLAWLVLFAWLVISNGMFAYQLSTTQAIGASPIALHSWSLQWGGYALVLLAPAITMNAFASERVQGTLQLLFTVPIRDRDLVLGKFASAALLLLGLILATAPQPLILHLVSSVPWGELAAGYLGLVLLAIFFAAFGTWISLLVDGTVAAYVITMGLALVLFVGTWLLTSPDTGLPDTVVAIGRFLSLEARSAGFRSGRVAIADIAWFSAMAAIFLTLAHAALQARRSHG